MTQLQQAKATLDDLYREPGKAELVDGRIVRRMPTGAKPGRIRGRIFRSLGEHAERSGRGFAGTGTLGFVVPPLSSGRESFCPDASYYEGPLPTDPMAFIEAAPTFAVEVRSENDYGTAADLEIAEKRRDYFEAGTRVVWDVDPIAEVIHAYRRADPENPTTFRRGEVADAKPAVPGWHIEVDWIFR